MRRDLGTRAPLGFAIALLGLVLFLPFSHAVITLNVNIALAGTYAWCWAVGRSEARVGLVAGVGAVLKLFPTVLALWPTGEARRRSIVLAASVVIGLLVVSLPIVGVQSWVDFISVMSNANPSCAEARYSIVCVLAPVIGGPEARMVGLAIGAACLLAALRVRNDRAAFVLFGAAMLAPVADMHPHYWLFAYVALVVVLCGTVAAHRQKQQVPPPALCSRASDPLAGR